MQQFTKDNLLTLLDSCTSITILRDSIESIYEIREGISSILSDEEIQSISNKVRNIVQREALKAIENSVGNNIILMATGSGKSKIAIDRTKNILLTNTNARILIVSPTQLLRDSNWEKEFIKWDAQHIWNNNIISICYDSLHKYNNECFDYVIFDEGHNITENSIVPFFNNNIIKECTLFTATSPKDGNKVRLLDKFNFKLIFSLNLDEAVKLGLVNPYKLYIINVSLDDTIKYIKAGNSKKIFYQTELQRYKYLTNLCNEFGGKQNYINRMRFIYTLKSKTNIAKNILKHIIPDNIRTLIFCGSIEQANTICEHSYHSKTTNISFNLFLSKIIKRLACVNGLNEGHNIDDLDCAFIVQINSNELVLIQRIGRIVRYRPNHIAKVIILCIKDTVDEDWLNEAIQNLNPIDTKIIDLEDLKKNVEQIKF